MKTVYIVSHDCISTCGYAWYTNAVQAYEAYREERRSLLPSLWPSQCSLHTILVPKSLNQEAITDYINEHALSLPTIGSGVHYPYTAQEWKNLVQLVSPNTSVELKNLLKSFTSGPA